MAQLWTERRAVWHENPTDANLPTEGRMSRIKPQVDTTSQAPCSIRIEDHMVKDVLHEAVPDLVYCICN